MQAVENIYWLTTLSMSVQTMAVRCLDKTPPVLYVLYNASGMDVADMANTKITIRIDESTKKEAQDILDALGLNMTIAITVFLNKLIRVKGMPFDVAIEQDSPTKERALKNQALARRAVLNAISRKREKGLPVALYDAQRNQPYIEYCDGRREYCDEQVQG
jgi:DNA-damage-inducible protein J